MKMRLIQPFDITRSDIKFPRDQRREAIRILHCAVQGRPIDGYFDPRALLVSQDCLATSIFSA
jgi:hypothetical protein